MTIYGYIIPQVPITLKLNYTQACLMILSGEKYKLGLYRLGHSPIC